MNPLSPNTLQKIEELYSLFQSESLLLSHLSCRDDEFEALNKELFDKATWINKKDYRLLFELLTGFSQRSWEIVVEYADGQVIGQHYANGKLSDHILNILKNGIICNKNSEEIKSHLLLHKKQDIPFFIEDYKGIIIKEVAKYIKSIVVKTTQLTSWNPGTINTGVYEYYITCYDSPFFLSVEHNWLPTCVEEWLDIDTNPPVSIGHMIDYIEKLNERYDDYYDHRSSQEDNDFYEREALDYLTGGQSGHFDEIRYESTDDWY